MDLPNFLEAIRKVTSNGYLFDEIRKFINKGNNRNNYGELYMFLNSTSDEVSKHISVNNWYNILKEIPKNIPNPRSIIRFIDECPLDLLTSHSEIYTQCFNYIRIDDMRNRCAKKRLIYKMSVINRTRGIMEFGKSMFDYKSRLIKKYIYEEIKQDLYGFSGSRHGVIAKYHSDVIIKAIKNKEINIEGFLINMACSVWSENVKSSNVKLLKICLKCAPHSNNYAELLFDDSYEPTEHILLNMYCFIKYGTHLETQFERIISNLIYTLRSCRPLDIMILHRRYRSIDNMIARASKVMYKVLLASGRYLFGKNLTKLALYYI
jgi:hypothetical protein